MFSGQITHYKWAIFNSYVKLPEGMTFQKQKREWNNIPTVTHSFIFQMGRYTTNHCFPYKNSIRKLIRLPVWHYILSDFKPTWKSSWEVFPYVPMNWWTVQMILCFLSWAWETHEMLTWKATFNWQDQRIDLPTMVRCYCDRPRCLHFVGFCYSWTLRWLDGLSAGCLTSRRYAGCISPLDVTCTLASPGSTWNVTWASRSSFFIRLRIQVSPPCPVCRQWLCQSSW